MSPLVDPAAVVTTEAALEDVVGARPAVVMLKSIRFLDEHCRAFLARSPLVVLGTTTASGSLQSLAVGGAPGFVDPIDDTTLSLGGLGDPVFDGAPVGAIALVPGYGETLRINGRLRLADGVARLEVEEAFLHCAKAIIRSELWAGSGAPQVGGSGSVEEHLDASPFVLLATIDGDGFADVSPKGDPAGLVRRLDESTIAIADRPGNHRTDTLHNLMGDPRIALLALRPGCDEVVEVRGTARVSTDASLLVSMRLRDKTPTAALVVDVERAELRVDPGVVAARLWDPDRRIAKGDLPRAAKIWTDHVRQNTDPGLGAKAARALVNEKALALGLRHDYRANL